MQNVGDRGDSVLQTFYVKRVYIIKIGTPGMIRTCDPLIRSQVLYPAELRVHSEQLDYQKNVKKWKSENVKKIKISYFAK